MGTCVVILCVCMCALTLRGYRVCVCVFVLSLCVVIEALKHARCQIDSMEYARLVSYLRYRSPQVCVQDALDSP